MVKARVNVKFVDVKGNETPIKDCPLAIGPRKNESGEFLDVNDNVVANENDAQMIFAEFDDMLDAYLKVRKLIKGSEFRFNQTTRTFNDVDEGWFSDQKLTEKVDDESKIPGHYYTTIYFVDTATV